MVQRLLKVGLEGDLELDGIDVTLEEYEEALKQDQKNGDATPIEVHVPIFTDDKSPVGLIFTSLMKLSDQYDHPTQMMMGKSK